MNTLCFIKRQLAAFLSSAATPYKCIEKWTAKAACKHWKRKHSLRSDLTRCKETEKPLRLALNISGLANRPTMFALFVGVCIYFFVLFN